MRERWAEPGQLVASEGEMVLRRKIAAALETSIELMNGEGAHWTKGSYSKDVLIGDRLETAYCSVGGIRKAVGSRDDLEASRIGDGCETAVAAAIALSRKQNYVNANDLYHPGNAVIGFNDSILTEWPDVREMFESAIEGVLSGDLPLNWTSYSKLLTTL